MIGSWICDICGKEYHKDDNKSYDGIAIWCHDVDGNITGKRYNNVPDPDGKTWNTVPKMMDVCPDCFEKFVNWIEQVRKETK